MKIPWDEIIERFQNAERLYEVVKDLKNREKSHLDLIEKLVEYAKDLELKRGLTNLTGSIRITFYEGLNNDYGMNGEDIEKAIDNNFKPTYEKIVSTVRSDNYGTDQQHSLHL